MKVNFYAAMAIPALLVAAHSANAQFSVGPRLGLNLSNVTYSDTPEDPDTKLKAGFQVGVAANIGLSTKFSFQPALLYTQKGFKQDETSTDTFGSVTVTTTSKGTASINYIEVPLNFVFTTGGENGFQLFAGPYVAYGAGGKAESEYSVKDDSGLIDESGSESQKIKFASKEGSDDYAYLRSFDFGLNAGLGYRQGPFQVQAGYGLGISNMIPNDVDDNEPDYKMRHALIQVSATYFFGLD